MKFYNKISASLLALTLVAGFTACSDEHAEYNPASQASGTQVFFPSTQTEVANFSVTDLDNSFEVVVSRAVKEGACNVKLEAAQSEANIFTIPAAVAFADGEAEAKLNITFDASKLVYDQPETITLTVDPDASTPYGVSSYSFTVTKPAPWSPWCSTKAQWAAAGMDAAAWPFGDCTGTCTYTYTQIFAGDDTGLPFYYRQSTIDPSQAEIRVDNWAYGVSLILAFDPETNNIQIEPQYTGFTDSGVGDFYITDVTHWQNKDYYASYPCKYNPATGSIVLNTAWMAGDGHASCYGYGEEYIQLDGFYIPDYSVAAEFEGVLTDKSQAVFAQLMVEYGVDIESAKALVVEKGDDAAAVADALVAGEVEGFDVVKGVNKFPLGDMTGELKVVIAGIADGQVQAVSEVAFEYYGGGNASPWQSLGMGLYTEDIVSSLFGLEAATYEVEVMESTNTPGLYRVMNPYSNSVCPFAEGDCAADGLYLEINAEDPEFVYVNEQSLGFDWGYGEMAFVSEAARYLAGGYDKETLIANDILGGTLKDGVITFPVFTASNGTSYQGILFMGTNGYYAGKGNIKLVLPSSAAKAKAAKKVTSKKGHAGRHFRGVKYQMNTKVNKKLVRVGKPVSL